MKLRDLELEAGSKAARGQKGPRTPTASIAIEMKDRCWVDQAETAYARFVAGSNLRGRETARTDAANEVRR